MDQPVDLKHRILEEKVIKRWLSVCSSTNAVQNAIHLSSLGVDVQLIPAPKHVRVNDRRADTLNGNLRMEWSMVLELASDPAPHWVPPHPPPAWDYDCTWAAHALVGRSAQEVPVAIIKESNGPASSTWFVQLTPDVALEGTLDVRHTSLYSGSPNKGMTSSSRMIHLWFIVVLFSSVFNAVITMPTEGAKSADIMSDPDGEQCQLAFLDRLFRLLTGTGDRETEAAAVAMLKLLADDNLPVNSQSLRETLQSKLSGGDASFAQKRLKPQFNPTGWRRKRDVSGSEQELIHRLINNIKTSGQEMSPRWDKRTLHRRFRNGVWKPKRKPLEFNPTGW